MLPDFLSPDGRIDAPLQALGVGLAVLMAAAITLKVLIRGSLTHGLPGLARRIASIEMLALVALVQLAVLNLFHHTRQPLDGIFRPEIGDGGLIENLTILVLLFPVVLTLDRVWRRPRPSAFGPLFLIATALVLLLAFGEEISWGQHWLGFTPPEAIARTNLQEEFNLHNYVTPEAMEGAYYLVGLVILGLGARLGSLLQSDREDRLLLPLRGLLILSGVLMCHHIFQELAELALVATGFLIWNRLDEGRLVIRPLPLQRLAAL